MPGAALPDRTTPTHVGPVRLLRPLPMTLSLRSLSAVVAFTAFVGCSSQGGSLDEAGPPAPDAAADRASFTESQVERGLDVYRAVCSECHYRSDFRGTQFQFEWRRRSVGDFYQTIVDQMPEDDPGTLNPQEYIDVVAFLLSLNGFLAGNDELVADEELLRDLSMAPPGN